jgi:hypothetical protein
MPDRESDRGLTGGAVLQARGNPGLDGVQSGGPEGVVEDWIFLRVRTGLHGFSPQLQTPGKVRLSAAFSTSSVKAGEGIRTLDVQLGSASLSRR